MADLDGKIAIVTGAGRHKGLGQAIATKLAAEGAKIVLSDIGTSRDAATPESAIGSLSELEEIAGEIRARGAEVSIHACDVRDEQEVQALVAHGVEVFGGVDIMINNAGIGYIMEPVTDFSQAQWDAVLDVNLRGCFFGIKHAALQMIEQGRGGSIVSIGSQASKSGFGFAAAYVASKHGLVGLTRSAAIDLGRHGIRVNMVCPNHVTTGLGAWQNDYFSNKSGKSLDQYLDDMKGRIPLGRPGLPDDVAKAVAFLCSDNAQYITAESMNVSGGEEPH